MPANPKPLLQRRPMFHSRSVEETRVFLRNSGLHFDLTDRNAKVLDVQLNGIQRPAIYFGYTQYGSSASVRMDPAFASYWIKLPLRGHLEAAFRRGAVICDADHGAVLSPTREYVMRTTAAGARLNIAVKPAALMRHLEALLGRSAPRRLDFEPALSLMDGHGLSLARFARLAASELEKPDSVLLEPLTMSAFEQFIMTGLLLSQPHDFSDALRRLERPILPRDAKRAIDFIEANIAEAITLPDIVAASGVAGRTLLKHFREFHGASPMRYLRDARFAKVRDALCRADPDDSVGDIAAAWGFTHRSRFAVEYRRRYGESPSTTLLRRPPHHRRDWQRS
jgi:AraC-like DNA-binding protein